ncbi:MAG: DUF2062 domain-containing protein [Oxalicibacterium faecigallinarum]|uniref:DUF2062 domain-containing protein n=1 Tax=Oxalicibacterium faecigallinarum TaxID=573741 RepID=UPI00280858A6|nr:DUF2062 domain-containing protein [Oxalicibacterium faecigallinarum]MDQ7968290.1 DUF2062 domain-containing protein [Oxalicibacterium faecigallinarum]
MRRTRFYKHMPTSQSFHDNRYLRPLARYLHHHYLWQFNRRTVAGGLAVGLFAGILSPIAQILFASILAMIARVNLPVAAFATLVTNPFTVPPIYYAAYRVGKSLIGSDPGAAEDLDPETMEKIVGAGSLEGGIGNWFANMIDWLQAAGPQLMLGLAIFSVVSAVLGYVLVHVIWQLNSRLRWKRRVRRIQQQMDDCGIKGD